MDVEEIRVRLFQHALLGHLDGFPYADDDPEERQSRREALDALEQGAYGGWPSPSATDLAELAWLYCIEGDTLRATDLLSEAEALLPPLP